MNFSRFLSRASYYFGLMLEAYRSTIDGIVEVVRFVRYTGVGTVAIILFTLLLMTALGIGLTGVGFAVFMGWHQPVVANGITLLFCSGVMILIMTPMAIAGLFNQLWQNYERAKPFLNREAQARMTP